MNTSQLANGFKEPSQAIGIPVRTCRNLKDRRIIPYMKLGHRTVLFDVKEVRQALEKYKIKAV